MIIIQIIFSLIASIHASVSIPNLQTGDVLLISFNCYECRVIENETNSKFSHSGVVIKDEFGNIKIAQSLGMVALYELRDFLKNKTPGTEVAIYRAFEIENLRNKKFNEQFINIFNNEFKGILFDSKYLWNNFDSNGRELLYCSEFIAKYLDNFLTIKTVPAPLTYDKNYAYWFQYFRGNIPENELGNSPSSFSKDSRFYFVGNLE